MQRVARGLPTRAFTRSLARPSSTYAAALIERRPVILPDPAGHEEEFWKLQTEIHLARAAPFPPELLADALREQERIVAERKEEFKPAPRVTAADHANDTRSLERALDRTLYLMVKEGGEWRFPRSQVADQDDALHLAAGRAAEKIGLNVGLVARAPVAHTQESDGALVFYHLAEILPAKKSEYDITALAETCGDEFGWFKKEEVVGQVSDQGQAEVLTVALVQ
eukprot:TRINITY_DN4221_c0_g2_i9.p1 TRINITY_DN4221_c0_g2~~TRINITY_DN4221_c0_g2_i9.p1  ORF type:complete len:224 (-),score=43.01 TRINITY_DN4221_c0_g2_i9:188-859(-)